MTKGSKNEPLLSGVSAEGSLNKSTDSSKKKSSKVDTSAKDDDDGLYFLE